MLPPHTTESAQPGRGGRMEGHEYKGGDRRSGGEGGNARIVKKERKNIKRKAKILKRKKI